MRFILALLLMSGTAMAQVQNRTYQDSMGRNTGRSVTDSRGNATYDELDGSDDRTLCHRQPRLDHVLRRRGWVTGRASTGTTAPPRSMTRAVAGRARPRSAREMMLTQWMPFAAAVIVLVTTMLIGVGP